VGIGKEVEIYLEDIKEAVSKRLEELNWDFVKMKRRGEKFNVDFFISRIARVVEDVLKRHLGEGVTCDKYLLMLEGQARLAVNCPVPGTEKRILVFMDPSFATEIDLGDVTYWIPPNEWKLKVEVY